MNAGEVEGEPEYGDHDVQHPNGEQSRFPECGCENPGRGECRCDDDGSTNNGYAERADHATGGDVRVVSATAARSRQPRPATAPARPPAARAGTWGSGSAAAASSAGSS